MSRPILALLLRAIRRAWRQCFHGRISLSCCRRLLGRDVRASSTARKVLLVMRPHGVLHSTVWISRILHSHITISISHLRSRSRRDRQRLRMRAHSSLILVVYESCWGLGLSIAVVISRHWRLVWWGVAVVSSRRSGRARERLIRVHCGTNQAFLAPGGWIWAGSPQSQSCTHSTKRSAALSSHQQVNREGVAGRKKKSLSAEAEAEDALEDAVLCQASIAGR